MIDKIIGIIKLFSPKYYDRITKIIIVAGIGLLSKPLWVDILNIFLYEFKFNIIGENDWVIGLALIVIALIYNTILSYLFLKYNPKHKPAFQNITSKPLRSYGNLCQEIFPLLKDNEYIFKTTGPNSSRDNIEHLRHDLTLWNKLKREVILPNNNAIKKIIDENKALIPAKHSELFNKMNLHIVLAP